MAYHNNPRIVTDGLALCIDANAKRSYSGSGSTITDLVTGNTGSILGSPAPTFSNGSFHLNGTSNYWDISSLVSNIDFTSNEASVVIWLKLDVATPADGDQTGIFNLSSNTGNSHYVWTNSKAYLYGFRSARVEAIVVTSSVTRTDWHMIAITTTPGTNGWKFYQNTELVKQTTGESSIDIGTSSFIGKSSADRYLDGYLASTLIYNKALSSAEISQIYNAHKSRS